MTVLDPHGFVFTGFVRDIDRYTYWVLPGYIFMEAAWYKLLGVTLFTTRALSVVWGAAAVVAWYYIVARLTRNRVIGLLAALVMGVDQNFVLTGATARMDMPCASLSLITAAVYLALRRRFHLAIWASCTVLACAMMTHPNALFGLILLVLVVLWYDRDQIRWKTVVIAAAPFVIAVGLWGLYVLKAPDVFVAQMQAQATVPHRFHFDWNLFQQLGGELRGRIAHSYRLLSPTLAARITGLPAILYFVSLFVILAVRDLRNRPGSKLILLLAFLDLTLLSCLQDNWYYLPYVLPPLCAAVAIAAHWLLEWNWKARLTAGLALSSILAMNAAVIGFRIIHNDYANRYLRATQYLAKHVPRNASIIGSGELAFALGFDGQLIDDCRLGYLSGKRPDYIVIEGFYANSWFAWFSVHEPRTYDYVTRLLENDYEKIYDQEKDDFRAVGSSDLPYRIYKRKN